MSSLPRPRLLGLLGLLGLLPTVLLSAADARRRPSPPPTSTFAGRLHGELAKAKGDLVYSPASVAVALAMTREGATAVTAAEMDRVLGADVRSTSQALLADVSHRPAAKAGAPAEPELVIANRLYADGATHFEAPFLAVTKDGYGAPAELVDFRAHREDARKQINGWVAAITHDKIVDLVPASALTELTRMVLVNAIYLKAAWQHPFTHGVTAPAPFSVENVTAKSAPPTMHGQISARSGSFAWSRMIDLPYAGSDGLAMLVVVPDQQPNRKRCTTCTMLTPLREVEAAYAAQGLAPALAALQPAQEFQVALPKFKVTSELDLGATLGKLGMPRAFSDGAEFAGMSATAKLNISRVIHKAFCAVDEDGTEAAAATAVVMTTTGMAAPAKAFAVDRSFLFFIHDGKGRVLFAGRVIDPRI
jgi:serpin B